MASSAWLVTTTSAWPALSRAFSAKQSVPNGQRATPMHSRAETLTCPHDRSGTPGVSSSRSPVSVLDDQAVSRCNVAAQRGGGDRLEQLLLRLVVGRVARIRCESC